MTPAEVMPDSTCPRCGAWGPVAFVLYNSKGAIVECRAVLAWGYTCKRRRQVDAQLATTIP